MMTSQQCIQLLAKMRQGTITPVEADLLMDTIASGQYDELAMDTIEGHLLSGELQGAFVIPDKMEAVQMIRNKLADPNVRTVHRVHFLRTAWFRVAVAVLMIVGISTYLWNQNISGTDDVANKPVPVQNDVLPGGNKATLTLADGSVILLDSAASGKLTEQAGAVIQKSENGEVIYSLDKTSLGNNVVFNTMSTPRGGTYQLILPDGSKVWLNAESSITFPTVFNGNTREVKMTGEVYFEIQPDKSKPFIVKAIADEIQVLGTSFNVNAYTDETGKTSLISGSVKVNNRLLQPGQALLNNKVVSTDIDQDIAWKNGRFHFDHAEIQDVMRQIGRWYDVNIQYEGEIRKGNINGKMGRQLTLSQVLSILQDLNIKTRLNGKTIIVAN